MRINSINNMFYLFDTLKHDLRDLLPQDRLSATARMLGRPGLVADPVYRQAFSDWRKGVAL
jgi:hypothetical protein